MENIQIQPQTEKVFLLELLVTLDGASIEGIDIAELKKEKEEDKEEILEIEGEGYIYEIEDKSNINMDNIKRVFLILQKVWTKEPELYEMSMEEFKDYLNSGKIFNDYGNILPFSITRNNPETAENLQELKLILMRIKEDAERKISMLELIDKNFSERMKKELIEDLKTIAKIYKRELYYK